MTLKCILFSSIIYYNPFWSKYISYNLSQRFQRKFVFLSIAQKTEVDFLYWMRACKEPRVEGCQRSQMPKLTRSGQWSMLLSHCLLPIHSPPYYNRDQPIFLIFKIEENVPTNWLYPRWRDWRGGQRRLIEEKVNEMKRRNNIFAKLKTRRSKSPRENSFGSFYLLLRCTYWGLRVFIEFSL